ncbi:hypothetical protein BUALT_Bualt04G0125300 [Buddleja alternifolia]|uniref:Protein kinase domain-containing protein n=1 Tax=Buddleja alternifolia TaxID=168488 RepID=A0AAV6XNF2_9LAMI|nr:hypothetical protein BUALT_Bualt04G0125300 [Buddleja alternifolia]
MFIIMNKFLFAILIIFAFSASISNAQQQYSGNSVMQCNNSDQTGPSPAFLYTCNLEKPSCKAFLMFRTKPPYLSLSSISNLTFSDPTELARINNISTSTILPINTEVIIPVTCSCSGQYYQSNTSYISNDNSETYFTIANETYQGLTTCDALMSQNPYSKFKLFPGLEFQVPLRCACPTKEQVANGTKFMFTYLITWNDKVPLISDRFNISPMSVAMANGFSDENTELYPFTTLLIPLPNEPLSSQMRSYQPTATPYPKHKTSSYKWIYVGIGIGASLAVFCFIFFLSVYYYRRKRTKDASWKLGQKKQKLPKHFLDKVVRIGELLKIYTYEELKAATDNFSPHKKLSNSVYRGILRGKLLVIKKMSTNVSKEIKILGNINHFNLISLYGVCEHEKVFYLVYEYLEEGSLKDWLHNEDGSHAQSWNQRVIIALDVANGLDYLHNFTDPAYVHKNINTCNILLNRDLRAKIANFGLARENGNLNSTSFIGEKGYKDPEYIQSDEVTPKVDVYAFGVVLLELITGKDAVLMRDGEEVFLSEIVISSMDGKDEINDLIDPRLQVKHPLGYIIDRSELALRFLKLSVACLAREPAKRPHMANVVSSLMKIQADIDNSQSFSSG